MKNTIKKNIIFVLIYIILTSMALSFINNHHLEPHFLWLEDILPESNFNLMNELNIKSGQTQQDSLKSFLPKGTNDEIISNYIDNNEDAEPFILSDDNIWYTIKNKTSKIEITNNKGIYKLNEDDYESLFMYYVTFDYDKNGNVSVSSSYNDINWDTSIGEFNDNHFSSYLYDSSSSDILKLSNPKDITITYTIKAKDLMNIDTDSYHEIYSKSEYTSYCHNVLLSIISLMIIIVVFLKNDNLWLFSYVKNDYIEFNFIGGFILLFYFCKPMFDTSLTNRYYGDNQIIDLIIIIPITLYLIHLLTAYCKYLISEHISIKDKSLCCKLSQSSRNKMLKKETYSTREYAIVLTIILMSIICFTAILILSFRDTSYSALMIIIVCILVYKVIHNLLSDYFKQYKLLVDATKKLSEGHFDTDIKEELTYFKDFQKQFSHIKEGFETAVTEEIKSEKMKTELISNVSHDLKTPLTSIITYIDLLKKSDNNPEDLNHYITVLDRNSLRLKRLIDDLFDVTRANTGNIKLNNETIDIISLIKQTLFECQDALKINDLIIKENYKKEKYLLTLDSSKTYRIFENLFNNVSKYALSHTRVYIDIDEDEKNVIINIKNISALEMNFTGEEIVERFIRGDKSRNTAGSGLGLAIAKSFTEIQNGEFKITIDGDLFKVSVKFKKEK